MSELWELVLAYFKQETVEPLKALLRFVAFGVAGGIFLSLGTVLIALGGLRALQTEVDVHFSGDLSWAPYLIVVVFCLLIAAIAASRIAKSPQGRRP